MTNTLVHLLLLCGAPPLLVSIIAKTKAFFAGRTGPDWLQPYYDLSKLLRKGVALSTTSSWLFFTGPVVGVVALLCAGMLVPFGRFAAPVHFTGDVVLFAYLLALARFCTTAAALDTGSAFEGMGATREMTFACITEPALFLIFLTGARLSGSLSLSAMTPAVHRAGVGATLIAPWVLVAAALLILLLAENCRIPVDDPNTHLELTMIHEVMVLDHSGPLFGLISYAAAVKLFVMSAWLWQIIFPLHSGLPALDWLGFLAGTSLLAVAIGVIESLLARLQMRHVPHFLVAACLLAAFGFLLTFR